MQLQAKANRVKKSKCATTSCMQELKGTRSIDMDRAASPSGTIHCFISSYCFLCSSSLCYPSKAEELLFPTMHAFVPLMPLALILISGRPIVNILLPVKNTRPETHGGKKLGRFVLINKQLRFRWLSLRLLLSFFLLL